MLRRRAEVRRAVDDEDDDDEDDDEDDSEVGAAPCAAVVEGWAADFDPRVKGARLASLATDGMAR